MTITRINGFHHRAIAPIPDWAINLAHYYFFIRVCCRNKTTRRKNYRLVKIEKLRLIELGHDAAQINAVCKYLVSLKQINADRLIVALQVKPKQYCFDFS